MAEVSVKLSRKPADLHAERPVTARKPEPLRRAQAQGTAPDVDLIICCTCWTVNEAERLMATGHVFACWNCGTICDV